jgi:DNA-binding LacI/PurR family transcriptional regulator
MALKELIQEGLIYREHGKGTFISPPTVRHQILIVGRFQESLPSREFGIVSFAQSLIGDSAAYAQRLMPVAMNSQNFMEIAADLKHYYPNAKGVLFFRDYRVVKSTFKYLEEEGLPYLFYGSDSISDEVVGRPSCFYPEAKIIDIGLTHLRARYGDKITFAFNPHIRVFENRVRLYCEWMEGHGIQPDVLELSDASNLYAEALHEEAFCHLEKRRGELRSIFCVDDRIALLFHNAALRLGMKIPEELAILGINDYPFCNMVYPSISSISIPLFEDGRRCLKALIKQAETGPRNTSDSEVKLVKRKST